MKASEKINNGMEGQMNMATKAMTASFSSIAKTALKVFAAVKAVAKLKQFALDCVTAAKAQLEVETKLQTVLSNVESIQIRGPNAAEKAANKLKDVASNLQKIGVIGDEVTIAGMQQLATFQLSDKEISVLSKGMLDLLAQQKGLNATQQDAVTIGNMIGKAMSGNAGALSKVGISFSEAQKKSIQLGDSTERAATIAEVLQQNVGGVNEALAKTDQGKVQQAQNVLGDMKETLGMYILPIMATIYGKALPHIEAGFEKITSVLDVIGPKVNGAFGTGFNKLNSVLSILVPEMESIYKQIIPYISSGINALSSVVGNLDVGNGMTLVFTQIQIAVPRILDSLLSFEPVAVRIIGLIQGALPTVQNIVTNIMPVVTKAIGNIVPIVASLSLGILNAGVAIGKAISFMHHIGALIPIVSSLSAAFAVFKLVSFAKTLCTTAKAFMTAKKALALLRIEKIKDKAETIYLQALYAKENIMKAASTTATYAQVAAMTVWNGVCGIATAVTTALGAAFTFLTSPIGLVILAITAVIAIGVLLYKNWDLVKAKALQLGANIKLVFQSIQAKISSVLSWLQQRFPAVFAVLNAYITAWKTNISAIITGVKTVFNGLITFIQSVFAGNWSAAWNSIVSIFTGIFNTIGSCAKTPLNAMISLVNTAISGINGLTGVINKIPGVNIGEIPSIPYLAKGATVTKPTLAMIGESGPETVVPHNDKPRSQALLAAATMGVTGNSSTTYSTNKARNSYNITFAPQISGSGNVSEIKKELETGFEQFKQYVEQLIAEREREVF